MIREQINRSSTPLGSTTGSVAPLVVEPLTDAQKAELRRKKRRNALIAGLAACCGVVVLASILIIALSVASSGEDFLRR